MCNGTYMSTRTHLQSDLACQLWCLANLEEVMFRPRRSELCSHGTTRRLKPRLELAALVSYHQICAVHYATAALPGKYLPACLITHTGVRSVSSPRAARRRRSFLSGGNPDPFWPAILLPTRKDGCYSRFNFSVIELAGQAPPVSRLVLQWTAREVRGGCSCCLVARRVRHKTSQKGLGGMRGGGVSV